MTLTFKILLVATSLFLPTSIHAASFLLEISAPDLSDVRGRMDDPVDSDLMWAVRNNWITGSPKGSQPATVQFDVPEDGEYHLWVKHRLSNPRPTPFSVILDGTEYPFAWLPLDRALEEDPALGGRQPDDVHMVWSHHTVQLKKGASELVLTTQCSPPFAAGVGPHPPVVESIIVTTDADFIPY